MRTGGSRGALRAGLLKDEQWGARWAGCSAIMKATLSASGWGGLLGACWDLPSEESSGPAWEAAWARYWAGR
jgi:hypothetical protein